MLQSADQAISEVERLLPGISSSPGVEDPRWQSIISIAEYIGTDLEAVWKFVRKWGSHADEDLRAAIATCLLEHLLEEHFDLIFPRVEAAVGTDAFFADTFSRCWQFGQATIPENARRFADLHRRCSRLSNLKSASLGVLRALRGE